MSPICEALPAGSLFPRNKSLCSPFPQHQNLEFLCFLFCSPHFRPLFPWNKCRCSPKPLWKPHLYLVICLQPTRQDSKVSILASGSVPAPAACQWERQKGNYSLPPSLVCLIVLNVKEILRFAWQNCFLLLCMSSLTTALILTCTIEPQHDKTNKMSVPPAKTPISLGIRPVWSESSLSAWRNLGSLSTHWVHSEDSDQTERMPRLIWVFTGRTLILLVLSCRGSVENSGNNVWHPHPKCQGP